MVWKSVVRAVAHVVPERVVTNDDLSKLMNTSDEWITERTGIKERRFIDGATSTSMLATDAAKRALAAAGRSASDIDLIVASTLSPDFYFPGIGVMLQQRLGCGCIPALDIRAQCSGFVYGISVVDSFIRAGNARRVLLVCAEVQSSVLDMSDKGREMAVLFGDGAGALVIEAEEAAAYPTLQNGERGVIDSLLGSDGSGAELLCLKTPGTAHEKFITREMFDDDLFHPSMDGRMVFKNAVTRMCETAATLLRKNNGEPAQVDLLVPHQANLRINEAVRERLALPNERVFNNIHRYGNTTSATIPICLSEAQGAGKLQKNKVLMTIAFGAGFTWGGNLICW